MKKEWYAIFFILLGLPLCALLIGLFIPLLINLINPIQNTTEIQEKPERIVSLAPNLTEILFALGLDEKIAAVSNDSDYPPAVLNKRKVGSFWQPNTEAIVACKPDLVITLWFEQQKAVADNLKRFGYNVLTLKLETIEELLDGIRKIGGATGSEEEAEKLAQRINDELNELQTNYKSEKRNKVLWIVQPEPLRAAGRDTYVNSLIEIAGGENAIGNTIQQYPPISAEEVLACQAEVIIQSAMGERDISEQQSSAEEFWSKWPSLPAVRDKRIYVIDSDIVLRLGPRLPDGIKLIASCLNKKEHLE